MQTCGLVRDSVSDPDVKIYSVSFAQFNIRERKKLSPSKKMIFFFCLGC